MKLKLNLLSVLAIFALVRAGFGQPEISQQPQSCTTLAGSTAAFWVTATGNDPLAYQWQKFSPYWADLPTFTATNCIFTNVQPGQAGDYRVIITNSAGSVTSEVATLTVEVLTTGQFATNDYTVAENGGSVRLLVQLAQPLESEVTVDFATLNGTATGADFVATNGTLTFAAGETNQSICVIILNDGSVETWKAFTVRLSNPSIGTVLGSPYQATVRISDNDVGLQFEFPNYQSTEDGGYVLVGVTRGDDGPATVGVDFTVGGSSAFAGVDFTVTNGTLTFASGQKVALFTVPILNDALKEANETCQLALRNPSGQVLGSQSTAVVTIFDNDPGIQFKFNRFWVLETDRRIAIPVWRGNDMKPGAFTVDFATSSLTASPGTDYQSTNGTLTFAEGDNEETIFIPIFSDGLAEADEQFKVTLSNPSTGFALGTNASATITIVDAEGMQPHRFDAVKVRPDHAVELTLGGSVNPRFAPYYDLYPIEVSSNLMDWTPLVTLMRTNNSLEALIYTDTTAVNSPTRFYRTPPTHLITPFLLKPTGPFPVGVVSRLLTDPARRNRYGVSTNGSFMIEVYYPAHAVPGRLPGLFEHPELSRDPTVPATIWASFMDRMPRLFTHATPDLPCASPNAPYPIVMFSPAVFGDHAHASERGPYLASHGYVVVGIEHYDCLATILPDGRQMHFLSLGAAGPMDRVQDLAFVLDQLTTWNATDPLFAGRLDLDRVAAMGADYGGPVAAEFAQTDNRCKVVVAIDPTTAENGPLNVPVLEITTPEVNDATLYDWAKGDAIWFQLSGAKHSQAATDFYWAFLEDPADLAYSRESARTMLAYELWFLNKYLKGETGSPLPLDGFPLVTGFMQK